MTRQIIKYRVLTVVLAVAGLFVMPDGPIWREFGALMLIGASAFLRRDAEW